MRGIAWEPGISRNTGREYLRGEAVKSLIRQGTGRPRKLEPYEEWIRNRVKSAAPVRLPVTVLRGEFAAMGFDRTERTVR